MQLKEGPMQHMFERSTKYIPKNDKMHKINLCNQFMATNVLVATVTKFIVLNKWQQNFHSKFRTQTTLSGRVRFANGAINFLKFTQSGNLKLY